MRLPDPPDPARYTSLKRIVEDPDKRVVVAFGGGGVPGIAGNLGLAHLLEQLGVRPRVEQIWGTSAGAVVGGGWASGNTAAAILELVRGLNRRGTVDLQWSKLALALAMRPFKRDSIPGGLIRGEAFYRTIHKGLNVETFEECVTPFRCIAVHDDGSLKRKVFNKGPLLPAIFSSMSLPGIVIPRRHEDGTSYYDGGLLEKTPLKSVIAEHARMTGKRELLLIGTHFDNEANKIAAHGFIARFLQTLYAMEDVGWQYQLTEARERKDMSLLLLNPNNRDRSLFDFSRVGENFLQGYGSFADQLQNAKLGLTFGTE